MKTIKLITLTLFIGFVTITNAQDETNDATWEETISFLKKNNDKISNDFEDFKLYIDNDKIIMKFENSHGLKFRKSFELKYFKEVNIFPSSGHITINLVGNYIKEEVLYSNQKEWEKWDDNDNKVDIKVNDTEWKPRIGKALQHLAYLASKKRKEKRKASGDKF